VAKERVKFGTKMNAMSLLHVEPHPLLISGPNKPGLFDTLFLADLIP
jgi:hypothetical protein